MKITGVTGCLVSYAGASRSLFEKLPITIEKMINDNVGQNFDLHLQILTDRGRVSSSRKTFGPDFIDSDLVGKVLPLYGNKTTFMKAVKFNEDGSLEIVDGSQAKLTEGALPRQSTVDQLQKIRKATKSTTIDDRIPKMKAGNLSHERNYIDSGIESWESFQKKNKSFIPSWNLKHLTSPYK